MRKASISSRGSALVACTTSGRHAHCHTSKGSTAAARHTRSKSPVSRTSRQLMRTSSILLVAAARHRAPPWPRAAAQERAGAGTRAAAGGVPVQRQPGVDGRDRPGQRGKVVPSLKREDFESVRRRPAPAAAGPADRTGRPGQRRPARGRQRQHEGRLLRRRGAARLQRHPRQPGRGPRRRGALLLRHAPADHPRASPTTSRPSAAR